LLPRFNNVNGQHAILLLQNPSPNDVFGQVVLFDSAGRFLRHRTIGVPAHASFVWDTRVWDPDSMLEFLIGLAGSARILSSGTQALIGKAVMLDPATRFVSEVPLVAAPR
jgi:hypothetical protein